MPKKPKLKDNLSVMAQFPHYAGYADYYLNAPASLLVRNDGAESAEVDVEVVCPQGIFAAYKKHVEVPFESAVEIAADGIFSPVFLSECDSLTPCTAEAVLYAEGKEVLRAPFEITALPFDWWEGLMGNAERVATFVRPKQRDCSLVLAEAGKKLRAWGMGEAEGYTAADKNAVRSIIAAVYAALRGMAVERSEAIDCTRPLSCARENLLKEKKANALELGIFACACLEAAKLHPILAIGREDVAVGVWLYETCFLDSVTDDRELIERYTSEGINNLSFFDVEDLFAESRGAYTLSEKHFREKLSAEKYECFADIRRCRLGGVKSCPTRGKGLNGYEIYKEEDLTDSDAPAPLPLLKKLQTEGKISRNKQWERRLLDLSGKNPLLNFTGKNALHLASGGADEMLSRLSEGEVRLTGCGESAQPFGGEVTRQKRELVLLEQKGGSFRVFADKKETSDTAVKLLRRDREADEETGARILYLALGFLMYVGKEDKAVKYAPLVLSPAQLRRAKGNEDFALVGGGEYFVNATLLEFLKSEYNIDVRGLGGDVSALRLSEIFAMVRAETSSMKGWKVVEDVYLSTFSFQRYLMWNDLRRSIDEFKKNPTIAAMLSGKAQNAPYASPACEDEGNPADLFLPLPSDSSQYDAVALSDAGVSFVLHGPPGTGKSQTITNMIANALAKGKRVLFVAEKKAALDVVKKRLATAGIGEFCLELHGGKTDKGEILKKLDDTLHLTDSEAQTGFEEKASQLASLRAELLAPMEALHRRRRLGISVYGAILGYLQNKNAPDVLDIESSFYDSLTESSLSACRGMIREAAAAAKECGGVFNSPFENVNLTEYSQELRDRIFCAGEVILAEIRHLKTFLSLFLEFYRQRVSTLTERKVRAIAALAHDLRAGKYDKYFSGCDDMTVQTFYHENKRLDLFLDYYYKHFRMLIEPDRDAKELCLCVREGGDWRLNKAAKTTVKKLSKVALHSLADEDIPKYLETLAGVYDAMEGVSASPLSKNFCDRTGKINFKRRSEFLADLTAMHAQCATVFLDYNPDAFNSMCVRAANGYTAPVLEGCEEAASSFFSALDSFLSVIRADRTKLPDELDGYARKASALIDNIDMLPNWCMYRATALKLSKMGLNFIAESLESGRLKVENILEGFDKNVYKNFLEITIPQDAVLSRMTVGTLEETVEKFRLLREEFVKATRQQLRALLIARLPKEGGEESLNLELSAFTRLYKSGLRGAGLRTLFEETPSLMAVAAPCMLMSPTTVAQYLKPTANSFDLVIFDEASQMSTAEAVGSIARAKAAVIVGDPKQLPPTTFFRNAGADEEDLENEDLESVLDDCLALGMPERHLVWHYRSKHESLITFSNCMYYDNKLCTFPSPDAMKSRVRLIQVDGCYDRGFTKRNRKEAEALVAEVVRRLKDPALSRLSMGIVTFSSAQQDDIERLLADKISKEKLEAAAYEREEPLFVKNLENVQGDERDVILFSVCYGPDSAGRLSLNFGPLNQTGGWRRLNVAVSRAREEMLVFSTMTAGMIDLRKTSSKGVAGLKAFLEFAERGKTTLAVKSASVRTGTGIGKYIAAEIEACGYECRFDVGASDFKLDVAVIDPRDRHTFILAILCDGNNNFSVGDRNILQPQTLKRGNWNVMRVNSVNYYNNPKREIKRIKEMLDRLTGVQKAGAWIAKYKKPYKAVKAAGVAETSAFITGGEHDGEIMAKFKEIVAMEEPVSRAFLKKRLLACFGIAKSGTKADARLDALIDGCGFKKDRIAGIDYFYKNDRAVLFNRVRVEEGEPLRKTEEDFSAHEIISLVKGALEDRVALYMDEIAGLISETFKVRAGDRFLAFVRSCIAYGEEKGIFLRSVSDRISLA